MKITTNAVHALSALLIIPLLAPFAFVVCGSFPLASAIEIAGLSATAIGTLWLAAGVYVSNLELRVLTAESRKTAIANIKKVIATASHHVTLGVVYTSIGLVTLIISVVGSYLQWW